MPPAESDIPRQPPPVTHHRLPDPGTKGGPGGTFNCQSCGLTLALTNEVISRAFNGRLGRAYLLNTAINVTLGPSEDRILQTGKHTVQDCMCRGCGERVGWRYEAASEIAQRYKEGKIIIERECVVKDRGWDRELNQAITALLASQYGLPVSTTMCITGATLGVAMVNMDLKAFNWRTFGWIVLGWVITVPVVGTLSGCLMGIILNAPHF